MEHVQVFFQLIGILILRATSEHLSLEYHFINESMSWADAQSYCRVRHSDLATLTNMKDHGRMYGLLESTGVQRAWIGLRRTGTRRWRWSDGSGTLGTAYVAWTEGQPDDMGRSECCVEMSWDGTWNDLPCSDSKGYVCYELNELNQVRFVRYNTLVDWRNAQDICRRTHTDLATVTSSETNSDIRGLIVAGQKVWIGLFNDAWEWSDGSDASYRFWAEAAEDTGSCAEFRNEGSMASAECKEAKPFVCEGGLKTRKTFVKMTLSTAADLGPMKYKIQILHQLNKELKKKQVSDFKLRWIKKNKKVFDRQEAPSIKEEACEDV